MFLMRIIETEREQGSDTALQQLWRQMLDRSWEPIEWFEDNDPPPKDD